MTYKGFGDEEFELASDEVCVVADHHNQDDDEDDEDGDECEEEDEYEAYKPRNGM